MQIADTDILNTFKQNVNKGGSLLFRRYYRPLILFSNSLLNDDTFSEDIVQDVFYHFINTHAYTRVTPDTLAAFLFRAVRKQNSKYPRIHLCRTSLVRSHRGRSYNVLPRTRRGYPRSYPPIT